MDKLIAPNYFILDAVCPFCEETRRIIFRTILRGDEIQYICENCGHVRCVSNSMNIRCPNCESDLPISLLKTELYEHDIRHYCPACGTFVSNEVFNIVK